jgi:hypothetical protein
MVKTAGGRPIAYGMSVADLRGARATLPVGTDWRSVVPNNVPQTQTT